MSVFLRWYLRSPLGIAVALASAAAAAFLGFTVFGIPASLASGVVFFTAGSAAAFLSGAGTRSVVRERERETESHLAASLETAAEKERKIVALRIPDPEMRAAAAAFSLVFGEYLDACRREKTRDPRADEAADEVLSALGGFLRELDGSAVERRFGLPDADPFPEAQARTLAYLKERTAFVRERRLTMDGGLGGHDRLSIQEELR